MFCTSIINKKGFESYDHYEISDSYTNTARFGVDCISLLGSGVFASIHPYLSLFGIFKIMRVFRMKTLIARSTADRNSKAVMNLAKLSFYLFFYLHFLACYYWIVLGYSQGIRYYRHNHLG